METVYNNDICTNYLVIVLCILHVGVELHSRHNLTGKNLIYEYLLFVIAPRVSVSVNMELFMYENI